MDDTANAPKIFTVKGKDVNYLPRPGVKTQTVIDTPAVKARRRHHLRHRPPDNPLSSRSPSPPTPTKYTWSSVVDHIVLNGNVGIEATAKPGLLCLAFGSGTLTSKVYTLGNAGPAPPTTSGPSPATRPASRRTDTVACTFHGFTGTAGETGTSAWQSDFDGTMGVLTYTINADGTGYTGKVVY